MDLINNYPTLVRENNVPEEQDSNNTYEEYKGKRIVSTENIKSLPMGIGFQRGPIIGLSNVNNSKL